MSAIDRTEASYTLYCDIYPNILLGMLSSDLVPSGSSHKSISYSISYPNPTIIYIPLASTIDVQVAVQLGLSTPGLNKIESITPHSQGRTFKPAKQGDLKPVLSIICSKFKVI